MESGSEITAKIRSAIKAKLVELGAYVDEELPDYIMVMIANKKTKEQMTNDLNLFLGKNSSIFTDWVHNILERLQAISQKASTSSATSSSRENQKKGTSNSPSKKKDILDADLILNERNKSTKSHDFNVELEKNRKDTRKDKESKRHRSSGEGVLSKKEEKRERKKIEYPAYDQPEVQLQNRSTKDHVDKDASKKHEKHKSHSCNTDEENRSPKFEGKSEQSRTELKRPSVDEQRKPDLSSSRQNAIDRSTQKVGTVRPMKRKTPSPEKSASPSRKRRSIVGQVVVRKVEEEELDYRLECSKRGHAVTSTVRVSERKITVPVTMQPKPAIFLKALNEANASVSRSRRNQSGNKEDNKEPVQKSKTRRIIQEEPNTGDGGDMAIDASPNVDSNLPQYVPTPINPQPNVSSPTKQSLLHEKDSRRVEFGENRFETRLGPPDKAVSCNSQQNVVVEMLDTVLIEENETVNSGDTRFFVTLEGVDTTFVKKIATIKSDEFATDSDYDENNELFLLSSTIGHCNVMQSTPASSTNKSPLVVVPVLKDRSSEPDSEPASPYSAGNNDDNDNVPPVDTTDDFEEEIILDEVSSATLASPSDQTLKGVVAKVSVNDDEERHDKGESREPPALSNENAISGNAPLETTDKITERCKFWPACKLADACPFLHPSIACRAFPTCRFGDRCLYIHPKCRYDTFCTNARCPFSHSSAGQSFSKPEIVVPKTVVKTMASTSATVCKFGSRCANPNCLFRHPKSCAFGANCFRPDCVFSHPTGKKSMPTTVTAAACSVRPAPLSAKSTAQKFKWIAPSVTPTADNQLTQRAAATKRKDSDANRPELIEAKS